MKNATVLTVRVGEEEVHAQTVGAESLLTGDPAWLTFKRYHVFERQSGRRLRSYPEIC
jgi:hypothetical protein